MNLIIVILLILIVLIPISTLLYLYWRDTRQKEHAVLRNFPILGRVRYITEKVGPELRQYLYNNELEGKPFNRTQFEFVKIASKYHERLLGYGALRDFEKDGYYLVNDTYPTLKEDIKIVQEPKIKTFIYKIDSEGLFTRKEHRIEALLNPAYLHEDDYVVLGEHTVRHPFYLKGLVGQSAMSFGSLGDHAITALSKGLGMAGGTWMNTGEGSVSPYHLKGDVDIIMQISPGLFGVRTADGEFSWDEFKKHSEIKQVKAFELKLAQGAKTRGGHLKGVKVTEEIAEIRKIEAWKDVDSPNRFHGIATTKELLTFLQKMRDIGGKPVGIKIVIGSEAKLEKLIAEIAETKIIPDFITVDGGEGGTGASYYELAYSVGLPAFAAIPLVDDCLKAHGIRYKTKIIASGKLLTPDRMAMALALGADLINIARGFMQSVGCIQSLVCHKNTCPVGVATTDPHLQNALVIEEKKYRACNYLITVREALFELAAVAGLSSPTELTRKHIVYHSYFHAYEKMKE